MKEKLIKYINISDENQENINSISELFDIEIKISEKVSLSRKHFSESTVFYGIFCNKIVISSDFLLLVDELIYKKIDFNYNINYVYNYLKFQTPYTSETIIKEINVLRAGENVEVSLDGKIKSKIIQPQKIEIKDEELVKKLINIPSMLDLNESIFHLSAGLDSSLLVLLAANYSKDKINTVSFLTLGDGSNLEIETSRKLSLEFNTKHQVIDLRDIDIFNFGKEFVSEVVGYPIAHPSHILDFIVNKKLSTNYKYIISGKGPDDCLAGYKWHTKEYKDITKHKNRVTVTKKDTLSNIFNKNFYSDYNKFLIDYDIKDSLTLDSRLNYDIASISSAWDIIHNAENNYLNSSILCPLNDENIKMMMYSLPDEEKIKDNKQKNFLRTNFNYLYPDYLLNMPKYGLRLDIAPYLKKKKSSDILDAIFSSKIMEENLNKKVVKKMIKDTIEGKNNSGWQIWSLFLIGESIKNIEKRKNDGK